LAEASGRLPRRRTTRPRVDRRCCSATATGGLRVPATPPTSA
jgi:hypothetical protein